MQKNIVEQDGKVLVSLCSGDLFSMIIKGQYIIGNLKHLRRRKKSEKDLAKLNEELKLYLKAEWEK